MILGIDPGTHMGWAVLIEHTGDLVSAGLGGTPWASFPITKTVIEIPSGLDLRAQQIHPDALIKLALKAGKCINACEMRGSTVETFIPKEWKGSVPKEIHNLRTLEGLPPPCRRIADNCLVGVPESYRNNTIDAIGLAKWYYRRIAKATVRLPAAAEQLGRLPAKMRR